MSELSIKLEGFPEKVQRIADALDKAFPGMVAWVQSQDDVADDVTIKIEGYEVPEWADPIRAATTVRIPMIPDSDSD